MLLQAAFRLFVAILADIALACTRVLSLAAVAWWAVDRAVRVARRIIAIRRSRERRMARTVGLGCNRPRTSRVLVGGAGGEPAAIVPAA